MPLLIFVSSRGRIDSDRGSPDEDHLGVPNIQMPAARHSDSKGPKRLSSNVVQQFS